MLARFFLLSFFSLFFFSCSGGDSQGDGGDDGTVIPADCADHADGTACGIEKICLLGSCADSVCGDGYIDLARGEDCEDLNIVDGDGCDNDCTFSCHTAEDCGNDNVCDGIESCIDVAGGKRCQAGTALDCTPAGGGSSCTDHFCDPAQADPALACVESSAVFCYLDADGDGVPIESETASPVGEYCDCEAPYIRKTGLWDCNDARADVAQGATTWSALPHCPGQEAPAEIDTCEGGECTFVCANGATPSFDFNCDGEETLRFTPVRASCMGGILGGCVGGGWQAATPPGCGDTGTWVTCVMNLTCAGTNSQRAQECR